MLDRQMDQWALAQQALALRALAPPALVRQAQAQQALDQRALVQVQILQTQARLAPALPLFQALLQAHHHSRCQARSEPLSK